MSAATSQPPGGGTPASTPSSAPSGEACPVCGAPLYREQAWCLSCGAAARTRLASPPGWRGPLGALAVVVVLALGVLAAALVDLAGGSGATPPAVTRTVTSPAAALTPTTTPPASTTAPTSTATTLTTTSTPNTTHTATTPGQTSATTPKLSPKAEREILQEVKERLGKLGVGKALPGTPTR